MSVHNGPNVIESGLVLCLDAGDPRSYPGSGTVWTDRSGNANNGTLVNGVGYNSSNRGNLIFDGSNDYVDFFAPNLGTTTTVEMWCKLGSGYTNKMIMGWDRYDVYCGNGGVCYNTSVGDIYGIPVATVSSLGLVNNWKHYVFEMRSDVPYTNNKIYINTVSQTLSQLGGGESPTYRNFNNGNGRISGWRLNTTYPIPMNCASFRVYNRALSADEIKQNFEATRSRFGI
jgi:hypothetical protein